jgi:hypothetical protein
MQLRMQQMQMQLRMLMLMMMTVAPTTVERRHCREYVMDQFRAMDVSRAVFGYIGKRRQH